MPILDTIYALCWPTLDPSWLVDNFILGPFQVNFFVHIWNASFIQQNVSEHFYAISWSSLFTTDDLLITVLSFAITIFSCQPAIFQIFFVVFDIVLLSFDCRGPKIYCASWTMKKNFIKLNFRSKSLF